MHNVLNSIVNLNNSLLIRPLFLLSLGFLLTGCQNIQYPERPKNLIPEDKMVEVLIDVHLFNAAKSVNRLPLQQTGMTPHQFIYEKHNIDSVQYEVSNAFYGANLNSYERIHSRVKDYLENQKTEIDTVIAREKRKQDSVKIITDSIRLKRIGVDIKKEPAELKKKKTTKTDSIK